MSEHCFQDLREGRVNAMRSVGTLGRARNGRAARLLGIVCVARPRRRLALRTRREPWGVCLEGEWIRIHDGVEHHVRVGEAQSQASRAFDGRRSSTPPSDVR